MTQRDWYKSARSGSNGQCVEVRMTTDSVDIRDTKNRAGGTLSVSPDEWTTFVDAVKRGEFDL